MDLTTRNMLRIFRLIQTGQSWDDCWLWTGGLSAGRPVARYNGERVYVRVLLRSIVHPDARPRVPARWSDCPAACVHPDHNLQILEAAA